MARGRSRSLCVLMLCSALIQSEQSLLAPNLSSAAAEFGLRGAAKDEKLGGSLAVALFVAGAPAALAIGAAADQPISRARLLALVLLLGGLGCVGSSLASSFDQLWYARAMSGVALGGALPVCFSLLGDMYAPRERALRSSQIGLAMSIGTLAGQGFSGCIGPSFGWRAPFVLVGSLMLAMTQLVRSQMFDPPRGGSHGLAHSPLGRDQCSSATHARRWAGLMRIPSVWLVYLQVRRLEQWGGRGAVGGFESCYNHWLLLSWQGIPGCVPWGVISTFLPDFLFADVGFSIHEATFVITAFTVGGLLGTCAGGHIGQELYNRSAGGPALLMFAAGSLGILPMYILIMHPPSSAFGCALISACGGFLATQTGPNIRTVLCNVTQSDQRGLAFASFALADDLGKGFGPLAVAFFVRRLGRKLAFAYSILFWFPCACLCGATALTVGIDEARAKARQKLRSDAIVSPDDELDHEENQRLGSVLQL